MESFEPPQLATLVLEEIRQSAYEIAKRYWPMIIAFRFPNFIPPSIPVPPRRPHHLLEIFKSHAKELFECEAHRYEHFRAHPLYVTWVSNLNNRVAVYIQQVFQHLEDCDLTQCRINQSSYKSKSRFFK